MSTDTRTKHTPGPWTVEDAFIFAHGSRIADTTQNDEDARTVSDDEADANARLISAAPELLAALKLLAEVSAFPRLTEARTGVTPAEAYEQALAAIRKATGGDA